MLNIVLQIKHQTVNKSILSNEPETILNNVLYFTYKKKITNTCKCYKNILKDNKDFYEKNKIIHILKKVTYYSFLLSSIVTVVNISYHLVYMSPIKVRSAFNGLAVCQRTRPTTTT